MLPRPPPCPSFFFFNDTATTEIYTLSLHDALPIYPGSARASSTNPTQRLDSAARLPAHTAAAEYLEPFAVINNAQLLADEAKYCSFGDTVHYVNPPKIFSGCEAATCTTRPARPTLICRCGIRP